MKQFVWLGLVGFLCVMWTACGETYRPIILPNPPQFPNPRAAHTVVAINNNGNVTPGSIMVVDVTGDSEVSVADLGLVPVHAVQQAANQVLVVNHSVTGALSDSITKVGFAGTVIIATATISLPANSAPNFIAVAPLDPTAYVSLPGLVPDPNFPNDNAVGVISTTSDSMEATIRVGNNPVALVITPDKSKLYVANQGDGTVGGYNTSDNSTRTINGSFNAPRWLIARSDSQRAYVLNGNGVVSTIDTTSTAGPDNVIDSGITAPGAAYMLYDGNLNRLYIPGNSQVTMLDVSQSTPHLLGGGPITLPTVAPSSRAAFDPCSQTAVQTPLTAAGVAALPDGSRAYVGAFYEDASGNICPQVTVIDAKSNQIKSSVAVPGFPAFDALCSTTRLRITMAAAGDSTRAYLASCDGGNVNMIDTSNDSYIMNLPAPVGSRPPIPPDPLNPPQNPVFLIAGP